MMKKRNMFTTFGLVLHIIGTVFISIFVLFITKNIMKLALFLAIFLQIITIIDIFRWSIDGFRGTIMLKLFSFPLSLMIFPELLIKLPTSLLCLLIDIYWFYFLVSLKSKNGKSTLDQLE
jgi:hypothetical protein